MSTTVYDSNGNPVSTPGLSAEGQVVDASGNTINPSKEDGNLASIKTNTDNLDTAVSTRATEATLSSLNSKIPAAPAAEHVTAVSPHATRLTDGTAFYKATTPADTQPVSGTVTANLGTIAGAATEATLSKLAITQGASLGSNTQAMIGGSVTTAVPTYTTGQISPVSLNTSGQARVETQGLDLSAAGNITALNGAVTLVTRSMGTALVQISGTWVATIQIQGLQPDGTTWTNLSVATGPAVTATFTSAGITVNGAYRLLTPAAYTSIRATATAFTSGTITVNIVTSEKITATQSVQLYAGNMQVEAHQSDGFKASYTAAASNITPDTTPLDVFTITGSATKTVRVTRMTMTGTQTTTGTISVLLIKRSTANTGGTSSIITAVPLDSTNAAATAVARSYTGDPTLGTTVGNIFAAKVNIPASTDDVVQGDNEIMRAVRPAQAAVLRGTNEVLAVNLNGVTLTGGSLSCTIEWTEE